MLRELNGTEYIEDIPAFKMRRSLLNHPANQLRVQVCSICGFRIVQHDTKLFRVDGESQKAKYAVSRICRSELVGRGRHIQSTQELENRISRKSAVQ